MMNTVFHRQCLLIRTSGSPNPSLFICCIEIDPDTVTMYRTGSPASLQTEKFSYPSLRGALKVKSTRQ